MSSTDPGVAVSTRRMDTVHMAVPDASIAAAMTARLGAPPVPMISREASSSPAMTRMSSAMSTSLGRGENLHVLTSA